MKKNHTKRQHYVSAFLLKQFTYDGHNAYVYDKKNKRVFISDVENVCCESDLYEVEWKNVREELGKYVLDNQIEDGFARLEANVGALFSKIIDLVRNRQENIKLSTGEIELITEFAKSLYLRNPYVMKQIMDYYDGVEDEGEVLSEVFYYPHISGIDSYYEGNPLKMCG